MNHLCPPHLLASSMSSAVQLVQAPAGMQVTSNTVQAPMTTVVPAMSGVMSSVPMPMGAIAIPGGATLQAVAVQAATMAIRQGTPITHSPFVTSGEQIMPTAIPQQIFTQAMIPISQTNCPTPLNFHIPQQTKQDSSAEQVANLITTMAQNLTHQAQQNLTNVSLAQPPNQQSQQIQQQTQQQQQQALQGQPQPPHSQPHQVVVTQGNKLQDPSTVSTLGLGLTSDMTLQHIQHPLINPQLLAAAPHLQPHLLTQAHVPPQPPGQPTATEGTDPPPPPKKKKKKKSKKNKVPTSLTPSSSSIPDKMVTYKPNCGESDMEAFMAYQRLCNTHLDLKAKLHLLYNSRHSCQLCHREFKGFCRLRRHLQSHADFRPYKCESCSKRFYNVSKLKRHNLVHSGLKPYKCPLCDSALSRREHLKRHMLTHSEERPYRCSGCDYSSRRLDGVHKHIKAKHPTEDAKVMYVRPQIFDLLSHDFVTQTIKAQHGGDGGKDSDSSPIKDPLTDKDAFLQLMMGNIKFSQLLTPGTTAASNVPKPPPAEGTVKKKKKKKRKPSNPMQIKEPKPEDMKIDPPKFGEGTSMTLPIVTAPIVNIGNGLLDSQRLMFQNNRSQTQTPVAEPQNVLGHDVIPNPGTPTPQSMVQGQPQVIQQGEIMLNTVSTQSNHPPLTAQQVMTIATTGNIKQESATPQPQDITNNVSNANTVTTITNHPVPQPSPMSQQFTNFGAAQLLPQGQQFFPAHLGEQVHVSMQNSLPISNTAASAFQSVYAGGTYEPVPPKMVPGQFFTPVPHNTMYDPNPFNEVTPGVAGIPPIFRRRISQGCRQINDMAATFHLKQKQPNFGEHQ